MKNYRATYDKKVIDAWAAQLAKRKKGIGKAQLFLLFLLVLAGAWMFYIPSVVAVLLFFGVGATLVITQIADRATLLCPNCHQSPISSMQKGTAQSADFCVHCNYWLKSPYVSTNDTQV